MTKKSNIDEKKWIEIVPYGIVGGLIPDASTMLFKKKEGEDHFVVWFSELQSRIAIDQNLNKEKIFSFVQKILKANNCQPKYCFFVKTEQGRDVVQLSFGKSGDCVGPLQFYADEVVSFCMMSNCRFFCTADFFKQQTRGEIPKRFRKQSLTGDKPLYLN